MANVITIAVGLLLAVLAWVLPNLDVPWKVAISAILAAAIASALAFERHLVARKLERSTGHVITGTLPEMAAAFEELKSLPVRRIRMLAYAGNYSTRWLPQWPQQRLDGLEFRLLVRNP